MVLVVRPYIYHVHSKKMICYMRCVNAFFIDITNIFVKMTDFSCHFNQKDTLRIPNECLCVNLTYYFLLCIYIVTNIQACVSK